MITLRYRGRALALVMVLAGCGGGGSAETTVTTGATTTTQATTTTTTEAGFEVVSEDGNVTVTVPESAAASDPGITIALLESLPPGLEGLPPEAALLGYELGPDGHEFNAPVTVTLRMPVAEFTDLAANEVPVVVLFTTTPEGGFAPLDDLEVTRRGAEVLVSGTTTHFSPVIGVRESTSASTTINSEAIDNIASARSLESVFQVMTQVPGVIPVSGELRDSSGTSIAGTQTGNLLVDGLPSTPGEAFNTIRCEDIAEVDVLRMSQTAQFGSDPIAGVVSLILTGDLFQSVSPFNITLTLSGRARCLDPTSSILLTDLTGMELATDHPDGEVFIPNEDFLGGFSGFLARLASQSRFVGLRGGLICDNNGNGVVDPIDTMFPTFQLTSVGDIYQFVAPLFGFADYFTYFVDETAFSGLPSGSSWTVEQGLSAYESMYTGTGRFEGSIGVVEVDATPFVYNVGPAEGSLAVPGARIGMFDSLRLRF